MQHHHLQIAHVPLAAIMALAPPCIRPRASAASPRRLPERPKSSFDPSKRHKLLFYYRAAALDSLHPFKRGWLPPRLASEEGEHLGGGEV
jgi:hypothetical protein